MKSNPLPADYKSFNDYINSSFNELKKKIENKSKKENFAFNEDIFMDTIVKCLTNWPKNKRNKTDIENYFWRAYKQNQCSLFSRDKLRNIIDIDECDDDVIDEEYNSDIDEINEIIRDEIVKKFGQKIYDAWLLHVCNNYKYTELNNNGYNGVNFHNEFRQIKRHLDKLIKTNGKLKRLLYENDLI